ncbi:uncharacterized protein DUF4374 [Roseivirga ehrenbergii]|uniref:DUF5074 domain-containing protein n=1 Tax=Roseivirga ehrenbergii (strain DSM 102268 / JCM 13514 / KCTC 12282 / NCIMB 14502 / KMM 6017) TaxID=279360 RepID=A0A150XSY5_ROSEK|nr:DUF4374 domain-containing protein [Roseivirga ehrenbergii]KYG81712.1 hypothetical protein MB14_14120 [Roseivirga ehrenbergii]TCL10890.1 uncharacterized protein DUF4374 [Roseivirga ehrenbergii]
MKNLSKYYLASFLLATGFLFSGCSDDNPEPSETNEPIETGYAISTVSGAWPDQTTYLQWANELNFSSIDNENAIELTGSASTVTYNGAVFATPHGAPANLVKYIINSDGIPEEEERIVVPGANTFSTLYFKSETVAYGTVAGGISKLIVFDPSSMRITSEISLSTITSLIPEADRTYYLDMIERDGKLFMGVHYENNFSPVNDNAYIAVINLNTNEVEKVISDDRTGMLFGGPSANSGMVKAANGDIYVQALGTTNAGGAAPSGVLRIKAGETEFDTDYFFNLEETVGNICYGIYYTSGGKAFTANVQNESDFWEYATGEPQFKYVEIDLGAKTSSGPVAGLPTTYASRTMLIYEADDNTLYFSTATNNENAVYEYNVSNNSSSKFFGSTGGYLTGFSKLD